MKIARALEWIGDVDGYLALVDQRLLPARHTILDCRDIPTLYEAIQTLAVRGAPAIGVSAAYGLVMALQGVNVPSAGQALAVLQKQAGVLAASRPTAVNLFWALDRVMKHATEWVAIRADATVEELQSVVLAEAHAICQEDRIMCQRIGQHGAPYIKQGMGVLTHCNAGALATAGQGTALSVFYEAWKAGTRFTVYADETRPLLQGARLTVWELQQAGIDIRLICDNMAGWLMKKGTIQAVVTGADRIAANGDSANKIGTYSVSVLAARHDIPFYIAAPSSTFDLGLASGDLIAIEQRDAREVTHLAGIPTAPVGIGTENPAFDVVDARDIAAIFTERGVIENPTADRIAAHFAS
jgi:methylthioribose-1-phosphate isomerase